MRVSRSYLAAVILLAVLAIALGVSETIAPPLAEESALEPQQESSSESAWHSQNPPTYDSGWVNITTKIGQYVTLRQDLNTTDVTFDITGKQNLDPMSGALAWNRTYGGPNSDYGYSVIRTGDGGYAFAGNSNSYSAIHGFLLVKVNTDMNREHQRNFSTETGFAWIG